MASSRCRQAAPPFSFSLHVIHELPWGVLHLHALGVQPGGVDVEGCLPSIMFSCRLLLSLCSFGFGLVWSSSVWRGNPGCPGLASDLVSSWGEAAWDPRQGRGAASFLQCHAAVLSLIPTGGCPGPGRGTEIFFAPLHRIQLDSKLVQGQDEIAL